MYKLDPKAAKEADNGGGTRIREIGAYTGRIFRARDVTANSGTRGIDFGFVTDDGLKASMPVWTMGSDGKLFSGYSTISAMMAVLRLRGIADPVPTRVEVYDFDSGTDVEREEPCYVELMGKPIGLMLYTADYENGKGEVKTRMEIGGVFDAKTRLVATEILGGKVQPLLYDKMVARLSHRPIKNAPRAAPARGLSGPSGGVPAGYDSTPGLDDDIPF